MTTTQTGSGNGAAPDGEPGRKLPTRAGWWWADMSEWHGVEGPPEPLEVYVDRGVAGFDGMFDDQPADQQVRFLAPIPGPEVCVALARYSEALDDHDVLWDGADFITRNNVTNRFNDAGDALDAAIRAERDGAA